MRAFLALGLIYVVTSTFTLAKCVRDRQEEVTIVSRIDAAYVRKIVEFKQRKRKVAPSQLQQQAG